MGYEAEVLADSVSPAGVRLTTLRVRHPRFILAEVNTHRMISKSSASSRAVPVAKRIAQVEGDPFVPESFGKNRPGMQSVERLSGQEAHDARVAWLTAAEHAVRQAKRLAEAGVHKQYANRLLEPFLWHEAILTATEWDNFFALRFEPNAQPEFQQMAEAMRDVMSASKPRLVAEGEWHLPYVPPEEALALYREGLSWLEIARASCMRCARVSYERHGEVKAGSAYDRARADSIDALAKLQQVGHMAPLEHAAEPLRRDGSCVDPAERFAGNFRGWFQLRKHVPNEDNFALVRAARGEHPSAFLPRSPS